MTNPKGVPSTAAPAESSSTITEESSSNILLDALDKMLDLKFAKLESRLTDIESKFNAEAATMVHTSGSNLIHSGHSALNSYFLPPSGSDKEDSPQKKDKAPILTTKELQNQQQRLKASDRFVHDCLLSIKTEIVDSLSSFDNKISEFSLVLEKQDETISSVHKKIENSVPENEIKNLIPKIVQLQKNLDALLAGESETNAIIDNVIPTISKLQKDVEEFIVSQKKESTKLNEEFFPKVQKTLGDIYDKTKDIKVELIDNSVQILDKSSKISKSAEDVKGRISRLEEKVMRFSPSETRNRSKDTRSSSSSRRTKNHPSEEHRSSKKLVIDSDSDSDNDKSSKPAPAVSLNDELKIYKEIRSQLGSVTRGMEHLEKEIRKFDITELVEERVIPNIYSIRKSMDQLVPSNANNQAPIKKLESPGRNFYVKEDNSSRKRFAADYSKNSSNNKGRPELTESAEDLARSRSPKVNNNNNNSSRSHPRDCSKEERKKAKERSSSPDSEDGEIQIMERQIDKISVAVIEIQDKMDSWLKYSKKTLSKSDENTGNLMEKLSTTTAVVNAINSKVDSLPGTLESKAILRNSVINSATPAKAGAGPVPPPSAPSEVEIINSDVGSRLSEFSSTFERHFFELSNKIDSSIGKSTYKAEEVITTTLLHRLDDLISRTKKSDSYIKSNNENTAKIFSLLKKIESGEKAILSEMQKNLSTLSKGGSLFEISKYLEEISPRLNDLYVKILPALDEIKKANDKNDFVKREDSEHIQRILDLVEDIKEEKVSDHHPPGDSNINQIYNALNDLKIAINSKDTNTSKILNELKADNSKLFGRINETIKTCKSTDKTSLKISSVTEELRKNNVTDAKTISQMNTVLQGLKASGPAYEKQVLNSIKDMREHLSAKVMELPSVEYLTPLLKSKDSDMDFLSVQFKSLKKMIEELIDKVNLDETQNIQQLLDSTQTIILEMFSKELKQTEKNILEIGTSLESHLEKNEARNTKTLSDLDEGLKLRLNQVETYLNTQFKDIQDVFSTTTNSGKNIPPNKKNSKKSSPDINIDIAAKLIEIDRKMFGEKEYKSLMEELSKYQKHSSEILNSVEDLKILTSSTPTAIHEIVPKIDKIHSIILDLPNEYLTTMAATEENLCVNLDAKIKDQHQLTLQEIFDKFDHMDSRLAVIKKYAKHGPMGMKTAPGSTPAHSTTSQDSSSEEPKTEQRVLNDHSRQMSDMKSHILEELRDIKDIKSSQETSFSTIIAIAEEMRTLNKRIFQEQAKGLVVEDQLEALCNTLMQPIQKLGCGEDLMVTSVSTSILNSLEDKQMQCLDLLSDLWSSFRGVLRHSSPNSLVDKEAFSATVKTAVEAASCPQVVTSSRSSSNEDSSDPLDKDQRDDSINQRVNSINKLIAYFKKVQDLEVDIISKCNRSIELQAQLNEHLNSVVPNVDRVRSLLEGLSSPDAERDKSLDALDVLCEDIIEHLKRITELSHKSSEPRSKSIDELKEFVQLSVSVMERLLKEDENEEEAARGGGDSVLSIKDSTPSGGASTNNYHLSLQNSSTTATTVVVDSSLSSDSVQISGAPTTNEGSGSHSRENHLGVRKRKRKVGPRSCLTGYVDRGPLLIEEGTEDLPLLDQRLRPVVKLVKGIDKSLTIDKNSSESSTAVPAVSSNPPPSSEVVTSQEEGPTSSISDVQTTSRPSVVKTTTSLRKSDEEQLPSKRLCVRKDKSHLD